MTTQVKTESGVAIALVALESGEVEATFDHPKIGHVVARCDRDKKREYSAGRRGYPFYDGRQEIPLMLRDDDYLPVLREAQKLSDAKRAESESRLAQAVPGLSELRAAYDDAERYDREFARMMEDESNDGARPPARQKHDINGLRAKYPRAALYLKAESYSFAAHWAKSKAGTEAMELLATGGSEADAQSKLDNWLSDNRIEVD